MNIKFTIGYKTRWGQQLYVSGSCVELGNSKIEDAVQMHPGSGENWEVTVEVKSVESFEYTYYLKEADTDMILKEFGSPRIFHGDKRFSQVLCKDYWRPLDAQENSLYAAPFSKAFFNREHKDSHALSYPKADSCINIKLRAPRIGADYQMGIVGSIPQLGNWNDEDVLLMSDAHFPEWNVSIPAGNLETPFEYKFVIYSHKEKRVVTWESGQNRYFPLYDFSSKDKLVAHTDEFFSYPVGSWKCAGVAIPVFSIRSDDGAGVGEFTNLKKVVDWSVKTGLKMVQVLPVNDTVATHTWKDSYPYAAISVQALHPIYANMEAIGPLKNKTLAKKIAKEASRLNKLEDVDYEAVMKLKSEFFAASYAEQKDTFLKSKTFKDFFKRNESWIRDYAAFSCLRDRYGTPDFTKWESYSQMSDKELEQFVSPKARHYDDVAIHYYIQFHLDKQLKEASAYAREHGVVLKGDIPIGIYRNSVDAWRFPHLFNMDAQAGAPPDDFSISGQNWGFPTYNWEEMAKDDFYWWKVRMIKMSEYFDVFRIDHILGFFRIWEIPYDFVEGLMGRFNPALPIQMHEFQQRGIYFHETRYCKPYIRRHVVHEIFGNHADMVLKEYLDEGESDNFDLKKAYSTQRKIKNHFDEQISQDPENSDFHNWVRYGLYRLLSEVLFIPDPEGKGYNPRIGLHSTFSYRDLEPGQKERIDDLYNHYFYRRHNDFWREQAMMKLPMLKDATDMLICGEDLGMVPASVPGVMNELQILSLAIQRMPNDDREFWHPADTPYLSVTSTGSHDMSTLREWWQEDTDGTQRFYNHILGIEGNAPYFCEPWIAKEIIFQHLCSPSMLAVFPIQDFVAMDGNLRYEYPEKERINVPANPTHYWRYRFHISMEKLLMEEGFNGFLRQLVDQGGRSSDY